MTLWAAGLAGFAVLMLEILGVHLLAPWFGSSSLVWSQQIGLILAAIAAGGWIGGRLAQQRPDPRRSAAWCLVAGGLGVGLTLVLLPWFASAFLPNGLSLDHAAGVFQRGSFLASLLFFVPPVFFLSMLSPLLVQIRSKERGAGRSAGEVSAAGTVGSLLGVFGATFLAIPVLGVRVSLILVAVCLALAGALLLGRPGRAAGLLVPLALLLPLGALAAGDASAQANLPQGAEVQAILDSPYQHLRVIQFPDGERWLQMNEGVDSFQSLQRPGERWPGGYYDLFSLAPVYAMAPMAAADPGLRSASAPDAAPLVAPGSAPLQASGSAPLEAWVLGFGAGSAVEPLRAGAGSRGIRILGVELDPAVTELGRQWLPLSAAAEASCRVVTGADARSLLRCAPADLDLLLLDAYARQFEIPIHLATREFFQEAYDHLRPGGVLAINLGSSGSGDADHLVDQLRASVAAAFGPHQRLQRVPRSRNWVLFARKQAALSALPELAGMLPAGLPLEVGASCLPGQTIDGPPSASVPGYGDDRNSLQWDQGALWWRES